MVTALLAASSAKGLVYDAGAFPGDAPTADLPSAPAIDADALGRGRDGGLEEADLRAVRETDTSVIFHSSGTTSGMPKLIPTTHLLMKTFILKKVWDCLFDEEYEASTNVYNRYGFFLSPLGYLR